MMCYAETENSHLFYPIWSKNKWVSDWRKGQQRHQQTSNRSANKVISLYPSLPLLWLISAKNPPLLPAGINLWCLAVRDCLFSGAFSLTMDFITFAQSPILAEKVQTFVGQVGICASSSRPQYLWFLYYWINIKCRAKEQLRSEVQCCTYCPSGISPLHGVSGIFASTSI